MTNSSRKIASNSGKGNLLGQNNSFWPLQYALYVLPYSERTLNNVLRFEGIDVCVCRTGKAFAGNIDLILRV